MTTNHIEEYTRILASFNENSAAMTNLQKYVMLNEMLVKLKMEMERVTSSMKECETAVASECPTMKSVVIKESDPLFGPAGRVALTNAPVKNVGMSVVNLNRWIEEFLVHRGADVTLAKQIVDYCRERRKMETREFGVRPKLRRDFKRF
jgi:hypothetical protein